MSSLIDLIENGTALLIDVRTPEEWNEGHAKGSLHWELGTPPLPEINSIPKTTPIYTYCRSGGRSERAKQILISEGFVNVTNSGGLDEVLEQGFELEIS